MLRKEAGDASGIRSFMCFVSLQSDADRAVEDYKYDVSGFGPRSLK